MLCQYEKNDKDENYIITTQEKEIEDKLWNHGICIGNVIII